ncbi:MAG: C25 family cysteine peptidase, partial [Candidatus Cloacimonetes bacterium]|nr:C25 family cysteine peptidase [Candidatus Cloacimonadota bacterium]
MQGNKLLVTLLMIIVIIGLFTPLAAQSREVQLSGNPSNVRLQNNSDYGFELRFTVDKLHLQSLDTKGGTFDEISIDGFGHTGRIGEAKLPVSSRIVAVPLGAEVRFEILASESVNLSQRDSGLSNQIVPAQASVSKSADYATLPFEKSSVYYTSDQLSKNPSFRIEEIGVLRGVRLFQFYFEPVKYNPVSGDLQIITTADIKVDFINPDLVATENLLAKTASWEFEQLYAKSIFNWNHDTRTSLVRNPTKMVILCPSAYSSTMAPYIEWKRKEGLIVNLVTVGTGGTVNNSTTAIKSYMQGLWNSATTQDPAPTYLIIVGDHGTTGNNITANTGSAGSHVTDLNYVRLNGTDYLPEMYFGRFSVSSSTELTNVINKTLMFAQTSMPDLSYLGKTVLIAGVDASWAPTHGNGAINYATEHYFNTAHGITSNNYPYPQSGSSDAQIVANAAEGRGYLNYTAHGSQTAWHDPNFTSTQMMNLTNTNKPFVAVGNCCITNEFDYSSPCFGEAIIRSNNAGAAYIGGTNSTYWDEDFYWAVGYKTPQTTAHPYDPTKLGAYDAMFHAPTNVADWAQTMGETMFMGNMAVQASTSSRKNYYWEIYSIMGDPSLMPYYGVPTVNTATFPAGIMLGLDSMNITAEAYSRVALSMNGTLYASEIVPASGSLTLNFTPFTTVGTADLVITRSGKITRQETIQVLPASGPYMTVETNVYADSNNNQPDYNESGRFNTTFKNVGANSVSNVTATLSCATAGITITDATESIASLAAGASITRNNAFAFSIANNVADGTLAAFTITMVSGTNSWTHEFNLELNAPVLSFGNITISDPSGNNNGRLDPGETVTISIPILNGGGAASLSGSATLSCNTTGITVNTGTANFSAIAA